MADVSIKYKGATIAELSDSGSKTLKTSGTYCEGDIAVVYTKPEEEPTHLIVDVDGSKLGTAWVTICKHELLAQHRDSLRLWWFYKGDHTITGAAAYVLGGIASSQPMYSLADGSTRCQLTDTFNSARTGVTNVDRSMSLANDETGTSTTHLLQVRSDGTFRRYTQSSNKFAPGIYRFIFTWD